MDTQRLRGIIQDTTVLVTASTSETERTEIATAHFARIREAVALRTVGEIVWVYCYFYYVAVDKNRAKGYRRSISSLLLHWPERVGDRQIPWFTNYATHADISLVLGDERDAFGLMALGHALGRWDVDTPELFQFIRGTQIADNAARHGFLRTNNYTPKKSKE